jgi:hypothetical protein
VSSGNRGRIECNEHGEVAWDVKTGRPFDNIALDQLRQIQELAQRLSLALDR